MAKAEYPVDEVADWLAGLLEQEYELIWSHRHPMDDMDWQRQRSMVEQCRRTRDVTRLRWMAHDNAEMPGYRNEWDW